MSSPALTAADVRATWVTTIIFTACLGESLNFSVQEAGLMQG